ncbi:hypothetical protein PLICRDRAFT_44348 [Plicaturopsis crispa FD-325 SS-3]|nr:hypothetical protein PLICRDRAFT_44348 [Plicaturopsis crispa FD-325 SS-3]
MISLSASSSSSRAASLKSSSQYSLAQGPASPVSSHGGSSSSASSNVDDDENDTITSSHPLSQRKGKEKSHDDLRLLAVSTHMTELSYSISDIQTRIFEIQELRHKSQSSGDAEGTTNIIDQSLMSLDERLEAVANGMKIVNDALEPLLQSSPTPTTSSRGDASEEAVTLRKHAALVAEWESVQDESEVLREELKEDKWLTVFRTVTEQADGMMSSLEKAVNRCQDFIFQIQRHPEDLSSSSSSSNKSDRSQLNFEVFTSLLDSFEAKKKHYMPATSKVLSIIDKGVQDRVTKNGETLRRHAESAQRWRNLRERITRTDAEMENVRKILLHVEGSEAGSSASGTTTATKSTRNGYLATPPSASKSRAPSQASMLSRSVSPFRRLGQKFLGGNSKAPITPVTTRANASRVPNTEPTPPLKHQRTSLFSSFRAHQPPTPVTPERPNHKHTQSLTPDSSPRRPESVNQTVKGRVVSKQRWNSSTKVESTEEKVSTIKGMTPKRQSAMGIYGRPDNDDIPPVPAVSSQYRRSLSRSSMASSRPWSPAMSSVSTAPTSNPSAGMPSNRPPSRTARPPSRLTRPPSRAQTPSMSTPPRPRPKTPSHIPIPKNHWAQRSEGSWDDDENPTTIMQRAFSPSASVSAASVTSSHGPNSPYTPPRPPSRSMIPVPSLHLQSASRPSSTMSQYRSESPAMSFRGSAARAQTPESALRARTQEIPFYQAGARATPRPGKLPPSSFRESSTARTPVGSRPGSRAGAYTPGFDNSPMHEYVPANPKDPLDAEVAAVVNSIAHGLLIERVDPPLKNIPKDNTEIKAQYAFSNSLSRKIVNCRLMTSTRAGTTSRKVMCRVGGDLGWQDLQLYMLNRQAGM